MKRQIVAIGGATLVSRSFRFTRENPGVNLDEFFKKLTPEDRKFEETLLQLTGKQNPRVCYVGTASGDIQLGYDIYYQVMKLFKCVPSHLSLFAGSTPDLRSVLLNQDLIYVGGGNTRNMLALWREWGIDKLIREAYDQGTVLAGWSAGSICWFEEGVTDSIPGDLTAMKCLGFLKGSNCPHYDGEVNRRPSYHKLLLDGKIKSGLAADDRMGFHFVNEELHGLISDLETASAYSVKLVEENGKRSVVEEKIKI